MIQEEIITESPIKDADKDFLEIFKDDAIEEVNKNSRFSEAMWAKEIPKYKGIIGGVGNIGSWLSLFLGRMDMSLDLVDMDKIEIQNIGGQLYSITNLGEFKVFALADILRHLGAYENRNNRIHPTKINKYFRSANFLPKTIS